MGQLMQQISVLRQIEGGSGVAAFTTWVAEDKRLNVGSNIVFKDPALKNYVWTVSAVYDSKHDMDEIDYRKWDNNNYDKHKGLGL